MGKKVLYGKMTGNRGVVKLYTERSNRLMNIVRIVLLVIFAPIWLPFYILMHVGVWSETLLDILEGLLDKLLELIIPRSL